MLQVCDLLLAYEQDVVLEDEAKKWSERMKGDLKAIEDSRRTVRELWKKICEVCQFNYLRLHH